VLATPLADVQGVIQYFDALAFLVKWGVDTFGAGA
jgi:hypothetical protein